MLHANRKASPENKGHDLHLVASMRTFVFNPSVRNHLQSNFITIDEPKMKVIEQSLRDHYFVRCPEGYLSTEWGKNDLGNHLSGRLESDRNVIIPWLNESRHLQDSAVLEIGCGTGCSTVALAEQGAEVTAIDVDADALAVASERCQAYGLDVSFAHLNAAEVGKVFSGRRFDYIIFYASLEHMTIEERMSAMRATWGMLSDGDLWCVIETPNRLWYYDDHTSLLPFHMWLPDELAFEYSRFSPRPNYRELYRDYDDESKLHFLRRGRGVSFHEFEITMKPIRALRVKSSLNLLASKRGVISRLKRILSNDRRYISMLRRIAPEVHDGFLQRSLYLIIEKD